MPDGKPISLERPILPATVGFRVWTRHDGNIDPDDSPFLPRELCGVDLPRFVLLKARSFCAGNQTIGRNSRMRPIILQGIECVFNRIELPSSRASCNLTSFDLMQVLFREGKSSRGALLTSMESCHRIKLSSRPESTGRILPASSSTFKLTMGTCRLSNVPVSTCMTTMQMEGGG